MKKITYIPSSCWNERPRQKINAIVLHCSAQQAISMIKLLKHHHLSSHYVIGTDGRIFQLVPEEKRAWHAGISHWREFDNLNHSSIGIELSSFSMGQQDYSDRQIESLEKLCLDLIRRYNIKPENIVAHSDIAPTRKPDPGLAFPWQRLAQKKIGLWYDLGDAAKITENDVSKLLRIIGYDTSDLAAASYAFCRHFLPQLVDKQTNIDRLIKEVYSNQFVLPKEYLPHLKACAYKYSRN